MVRCFVIGAKMGEFWVKQIYFHRGFHNLQGAGHYIFKIVGQCLLQPIRWLKIYFGPALPYMYRVIGPGKWSGAVQTLFSFKSRIRPTAEELKDHVPLWKKILAGLALVVISVLWLAYLGAIIVGPLCYFVYQAYVLCFSVFNGAKLLWGGLCLLKEWIFGWFYIPAQVNRVSITQCYIYKTFK